MRTIRSRSPAEVLMVTNMWPWEGNAAYGIFVRRQVESLRELGCHSDVLVVEGQRRRSDYLRAAMRMLVLNFSSRRPKLVHGHGGETALVVRWYWRGKVIVSYCGDDLLGTPRADGSLTKASLVRRLLLRRLAPLMDATITKSAEMRDVLPPRAWARNLVLPNGVDRSVFRPRPRDQVRAGLGWNASERVVLFAADPAVERKRFRLAEAACGEVPSDVGPVRLHVAWGSTPGEMPELMAAADCLLLTSAIEGSPNVVKEAAACGLPVVTTDVGDVREVLRSVEPSWICPPDPSILGTALTECLRAGCRSNGWEQTGWLDQRQIGRRLIELYGALGAGQPSS